MKTREQIVECIYRVLHGKMASEHLSAFHSDSRLREDLALDSSSALQLLVHLEVEHGLQLPEEALMNKDLDTVRSVAKLLYDAQPRRTPGRLLEYEEDIKLHCFVSCLGEIIKRHDLDQRVLYFGVWDSDIVITDGCEMSYHSEAISHDAFVERYEQLFGITMHSWYRRHLSKEENVAQLISLVENRTEDQHIMVMLDMHRLPERVNEFNKDPFPHYLMLGPTPNPDEWMVYDPDYRWEGVTKKERILHAMRHPAVAGGFVFSDKTAREPTPQQIKACYEACMLRDRNVMTEAIRSVLSAHLDGNDRRGEGLSLSHLSGALDEIPILSIRKYSYEHGFAFFWRELELAEAEFDHWCEVIAELVKTYKVIQFQALKLATTGNRAIAEEIFRLLDRQDERERTIKHRMHEVYLQWCDQVFALEPSRALSGVGS